MDLASALRRCGLDFAQWWEGAKHDAACSLYCEPACEPDALASLRREFPREVEALREVAERVLEHRFSLLGCDYTPVDPDRAPGPDGYVPIDWYLDPVSGLRFPRGVPLEDWDLYAMRPGLADVKLPWELARAQHWTALAQAYLFEGDPRFAKEILNQLIDFREANPVGIGIHWTCTMDVAIRATNWALALRMLRHAPPSDVPADFWPLALEALHEHGEFIRSHLENHYEVTSNHFLSNVVGLSFLGRVFANLETGQSWIQFARTTLEEEIEKQILEDGADFESSVPYHRLVTELFLAGARLADLEERPLSQRYHARLQSMLGYLAAVLRPDGRMPQLGDADDGRLHIFADYGRWDPQDGRHLFGPGSALLGSKIPELDPSWKSVAGSIGRWEAAWWGYLDFAMPDAPPADRTQLPAVGRHFPQAGVAVSRDAEHYLLVTNAIVGTEGFGNHKHNDQLSFELHLDDHALLVDPGSDVYTGNPDSRNRFRGTESHNTLRVGGEEQNETRADWLFRLIEAAHAETLAVKFDPTHTEYLGRHRGYTRFPQPVVHERAFRFLREDRVLVVVDRLLGAGDQPVDWHFHGAPGTRFERKNPETLEITVPSHGQTYELRHPSALAGEPVASEYSPSYGVRVPCPAIDLRLGSPRTDETLWVFAVAPGGWLADQASTLDTVARELADQLRSHPRVAS